MIITSQEIFMWVTVCSILYIALGAASKEFNLESNEILFVAMCIFVWPVSFCVGLIIWVISLFVMFGQKLAEKLKKGK